MRYLPIAIIASAITALIMVAALNGSAELPVQETPNFIRAAKEPPRNLMREVRVEQRETKRLQIAGRYAVTMISKPIARVRKSKRLGKLRYWKRQHRIVLRNHYLAPPPWGSLARCESGAAWGYNGSSGFDGGLQFHPGTWSAYVLRGFPGFAYLATPRQQILIAIRVQAAQGWGAWPACSRALGLR